MCKYIDMCICICIYMVYNIYTHILICIRVYISMYIYANVHIFTLYIYIYTYMDVNFMISTPLQFFPFVSYHDQFRRNRKKNDITKKNKGPRN